MEKVNLEELKAQSKGTSFYELILYHLKRGKNTDKLREASVETIALLPQPAQSIAVEFIDKWNERIFEESFWQRDTSEVFTEIIEDARSLLLSSGAPTDDETLFNMFQVVTLSYAYNASFQPNMRKFIKKGIRSIPFYGTRAMNKMVFKRGLIITSVLMVVWAIGLEFIPEGWWVRVINILGILLTYWVLLSTVIPFFHGSKRTISTIIAVISSGALWFVMFVAVRFIIETIFGTT
ncbi:hypothetical protein ACFLWI_08645 [Chloroflexota bacterium]